MLRLVLAALTVTALGCNQDNLNAPCSLRYGDGGMITEREARELTNRNNDFVQLGNTDCDSLICVRDTSFKPDMMVADTDQALGYCSKECITVGNVCETAKPEEDQPNSSKRLTCKQLLLNEAVLADPQVRASLGVSTSLFCSRSARLDAGS